MRRGAWGLCSNEPSKRRRGCREVAIKRSQQRRIDRRTHNETTTLRNKLSSTGPSVTRLCNSGVRFQCWRCVSTNGIIRVASVSTGSASLPASVPYWMAGVYELTEMPHFGNGYCCIIRVQVRRINRFDHSSLDDVTLSSSLTAVVGDDSASTTFISSVTCTSVT